MTSADKAAGAWNWLPSISQHQDGGTAACKSSYCTYCCCIKGIVSCGRQRI